MVDPIFLAKNAQQSVYLVPKMANRHGCITGATGTGKTVSLQVMAEAFSQIGTPVFVADIKGDLSGISQAAVPSEGLTKRLEKLSLPEPHYSANPAVFWDVFGEKGHPIRVTVSDLGPMLLSRMLDLNDTQEGIVNILFKLADDESQLILDFKDLRAMLQHVGERSAELKLKYGNVSSASIGAIQRALLRLEAEGANHFFGEPALDIFDWLRQDAQGRGMVNILSATQLFKSPRLYSIFLLWMLAELFERLPEVGDVEQPKFVFFFDEAHLLFNSAPPALTEKVEQLVRLIRSKGVGVYFITQSPSDIPDAILGQLGHRVQHALRAFTPRDQKAVRAAAQTMRPNPSLNIEQSITELSVGEALVSMLDEKGSPTITERVWMRAPASRIGPASDQEIQKIQAASMLGGKYDQVLDRESAYEVLQQKTQQAEQAAAVGENPDMVSVAKDFLFGSVGPRGGKKDGLVQSMLRTEVRRQATRLLRGVLGSIIKRR